MGDGHAGIEHGAEAGQIIVAANPGMAQNERSIAECIDPYWLETVFPDPVVVFQFDSPSMHELATDCVFALDTTRLYPPLLLLSVRFVSVFLLAAGLIMPTITWEGVAEGEYRCNGSRGRG